MRRAFAALLLVAMRLAAVDEDPACFGKPGIAWTWVEGKGGECGASEPAALDTLKDAKYWLRSKDRFAGELGWSFRSANVQLNAFFEDLGALGVHDIKMIRYRDGENECAGVLVARGNDGRYRALLKWSGDMPAPEIHDTGYGKVLVLQRNFGVLYPLVSTWAWLDTPVGPVRVDTAGAMREALDKVSKNHNHYHTAFDWKALHCAAGAWEGAHRNKISVNKTLSVLFTIEAARLVPKRVVLTVRDSKERSEWP
ncbi:MAG: hypothetical protein JNL98_32515 [Bryobacterales bacterium]|nr:hypothetical protein [Bryobacterales bacterium]